MAKYTNPSKLSSGEQRELLIQLCRVIAKLNSPLEAAKFLKEIEGGGKIDEGGYIRENFF